MRNHLKASLRLIAYALLTVYVPLWLFTYACFANHAVNQVRLACLSARLAALAGPHDGDVVQRYAVVENIYRTSNSLSLFAAELRRYDGPPELVRRRLQGTKVPVMFHRLPGVAELEFLPAGKVPYSTPLDYIMSGGRLDCPTHDGRLKRDPAGHRYYIIYVQVGTAELLDPAGW